MRPQDVPAGPLALDTDVFSMLHVKKERHADFAPLVAGRPVGLPFAVVGELKVLAIRSNWGARKGAELEAAIHRRGVTVIPSTAAIVDQWAELSARFLDRLKGGGINDMWVAACCLVHGLPLVTNNLSDFRTIAAEFPALQLVHPDL